MLFMNAIPTLATIQRCYAETSVASLLCGVIFKSPWRARVFVWAGLGVVPFAPIWVLHVLKGVPTAVLVLSVVAAFCMAVLTTPYAFGKALDQQYAREWTRCGGSSAIRHVKRAFLRYAIFSWHLNEEGVPGDELQRAVEYLRLLPQRSVGDFSKFGYMPALAGAGISAILGIGIQETAGSAAISMVVIAFLLLVGLVSHQVMRAMSDSNAEMLLFVEWFLLERQ